MISPAECRLLYDLARRVTSGCLVEIGSYRGRSTIALAAGSRAGARVSVYAIEPHAPFVGVLGGRFGPPDREAFMRNLLAAGVTDVVRLVSLPSSQAFAGWTESISLLWIDGDHQEGAVRSDFDSWTSRVADGGIVALHDTDDPALGPARVAAAAMTAGFCRVDRVDRTTVLRKG
ncbi:MAG TPA: class I SAM-dependent methyltransferase [Thermoanaerobaculia bacterium]|nr:class I SAM-dependent methyltransferase [Thermoanaerobaculia bacterium]